MTNRQRAAAPLVTASNTAAGWWLCNVTWLVMNLHVDDGIAAHMSSNDWWLAAALRLAVACVAAAAMAALLFGLNRVIVKSPGLAVRRWATWPASLVAVLVLAVGLSGSIRFLIVRPWF